MEQHGEPRTGFLTVPLKECSSSEVLDGKPWLKPGVLLEAQGTAVLALSSPQEDHDVNGSHSGQGPPPKPSSQSLCPVSSWLLG